MKSSDETPASEVGGEYNNHQRENQSETLLANPWKPHRRVRVVVKGQSGGNH